VPRAGKMLIDHVVFYEKLKNEIVQSENSNIEISELSDAEQTTLENDPENALLVIALISACECSKGTHSPSLLYSLAQSARLQIKISISRRFTSHRRRPTIYIV
jgi:hypothetical protein